MIKVLCAALSISLGLILTPALWAKSDQKRVPTEQEDLQMLYEASVKQQKALQEMLKKSKGLLEDYKKNPKKYQDQNSKASGTNSTAKTVGSQSRNSDGIPVQNLNRGSASSISPVRRSQPQVSQEQLDELLRNVEKMQKGMEQRNKAIKKFE